MHFLYRNGMVVNEHISHNGDDGDGVDHALQDSGCDGAVATDQGTRHC